MLFDGDRGYRRVAILGSVSGGCDADRQLLRGVADHLEEEVQRHQAGRKLLRLANFADGPFKALGALVLGAFLAAASLRLAWRPTYNAHFYRVSILGFQPMRSTGHLRHEMLRRRISCRMDDTPPPTY